MGKEAQAKNKTASDFFLLLLNTQQQSKTEVSRHNVMAQLRISPVKGSVMPKFEFRSTLGDIF